MRQKGDAKIGMIFADVAEGHEAKEKCKG